MVPGSLPISIDPGSTTPIYQQLIEQFRYRVAAGTLRAGDEVPSVRALATEQAINPNTVARAYRELERDGLLVKRRGMGTYVAEGSMATQLSDRIAIVRQQMAQVVKRGRELALTDEQLRAALEAALGRGAGPSEATEAEP